MNEKGLTTKMEKAPSLQSVKEAIYEIITAGTGSMDKDIQAAQNMDISVSNSVREKGVHVIQVQNVTGAVVVEKAIECLRELDKLLPYIDEPEQNHPILIEQEELIKIEHRMDIEQMVEKLVFEAIHASWSMDRVISLIKEKMCLTAREHTLNNTAKAAELIKVPIHGFRKILRESGNPIGKLRKKEKDNERD